MFDSEETSKGSRKEDKLVRNELKVTFFGWKQIGEKDNKDENSLMKAKVCTIFEIIFLFIYHYHKIKKM